MAWSLDGATVAQVERLLAVDRSVMPLPDALTRRLGVGSWMLTIGPDARLRAITVLGDRKGAVALPPPAEPPRAGSLDPLACTYPLPPAGILARLVGGPAATGRQLVDLALRQDDPEVRAEASRVGVAAAMKDPALERSLLAALEPVDDATLAAGLSAVAGEGALGLVSLVAEGARGRPLGTRAAKLRALLERPP